MRARVVTVLLVLGLSGVGVPSAVADETPPTPETTAQAVEVEQAPPTEEPPAPPDDAPPQPAPEEQPPQEAPPQGEPTAEIPDGAAPSGDTGKTDAVTVPAGEGDGGEDPEGAPEEQSQSPAVGVVHEALDEVALLAAPADAELAAAAVPRNDPRATVGDVDCTSMTVPVTLDNTRSADAVTFEVLAGDIEAEEPAFEDTVTVPAGEVRVVDVPVTEDTEITVIVEAAQGDDEFPATLAFALVQVDCTPDGAALDPQARIGDVDCESLTVDVTLDNTRSTEPMTYVVAASGPADVAPTYEETFDVPAGATRTVLVPVEENSSVVVAVGDEHILDETGGEEGLLALEFFQVDCVPGRDDPRASIGDVDCTTLTIPVTLDNRRSSTEVTFLITVADDRDLTEDSVTVAAGEQRVVHIAAEEDSDVFVAVTDDQLFGGGGLFEARDIRVDCNRPAARPIPRFGAQNAGLLAATGGSGLLLLPFVGLVLLGAGGSLMVATRRR